MSGDAFKIGAYHEAGHAVMGFYSGFKIDCITLLTSDPGSGYTKFDYGRDTMLIAAILNAKKDPSFFNSLPDTDKARTRQAAAKIFFTLIGGPVSEAINKFGVKYKGNMEVGIKDPDAEGIEASESVMSQFNKSHSSTFINDTIHDITEILRGDDFWKVISALAEELIKKKKMSRIEVEAIFSSYNFQKNPDA